MKILKVNPIRPTDTICYALFFGYDYYGPLDPCDELVTTILDGQCTFVTSKERSTIDLLEGTYNRDDLLSGRYDKAKDCYDKQLYESLIADLKEMCTYDSPAFYKDTPLLYQSVAKKLKYVIIKKRI